MTEIELTAEIIALCKSRGYLVHHCGSATFCEGKGFPDLVIVSPKGVIFAELKVSSMARVSPEQTTYAHMLRAAGAHYRRWTAADWKSRRVHADLERLGPTVRVLHVADETGLPGHSPAESAGCPACQAESDRLPD